MTEQRQGTRSLPLFIDAYSLCTVSYLMQVDEHEVIRSLVFEKEIKSI